MKKVFILIISLFLLACDEKEGFIEAEISYLPDCTDSSLGRLQFYQIEPLVNVKDNNNGSVFRIKFISDIDFGRVLKVELNPKLRGQDETAEERYYQKKKYLNKVKKSFDDLSKGVEFKDHSIIYHTIATELNLLSKSKASKRALITNSDLKENSDLLSVYNEVELTLFIESPRKVENRFRQAVQIDSLNGVIVYFTYQPKDFADNYVYSKILKVYINIISRAGGICYTSLPSP